MKSIPLAIKIILALTIGVVHTTEARIAPRVICLTMPSFSAYLVMTLQVTASVSLQHVRKTYYSLHGEFNLGEQGHTMIVGSAHTSNDNILNFSVIDAIGVHSEGFFDLVEKQGKLNIDIGKPQQNIQSYAVSEISCREIPGGQ